MDKWGDDSSINPANLRWRYMLEEIRNESRPEEIELCIRSLRKFPLVTIYFLIEYSSIDKWTSVTNCRPGWNVLASCVYCRVLVTSNPLQFAPILSAKSKIIHLKQGSTLTWASSLAGKYNSRVEVTYTLTSRIKALL